MHTQKAVQYCYTTNKKTDIVNHLQSALSSSDFDCFGKKLSFESTK